MNDLETRFCNGCVRFLPVDRFRLRSKGGRRMRRCNDCHAAAERERRAERRANGERRRLRQHFAAIVDERNQQRIELLTAAMLDDFGGLIGFAVAWQDYLADSRQRGGLAMFRALQLMMRLIEHQDDQRPIPSEMSDEELEAAIERQTREFIAAHPEIAVTAAAELGWRVIPLYETAESA